MSAPSIRDTSAHPVGPAADRAAPPASPPTADELLVQTAQGDEHAFATLYDHASAQVFGLISTVLRDPAEAEDLAHEVWLQAWRSAPLHTSEQGGARSWVLTLAHRRAVDRVRSARSAVPQHTRSASHEDTGDRRRNRVADSGAGDLDLRRFPRRLEALTGLQRLAVVMAYYHGRTYQEIGDLLGATLPEVKAGIRDGLLRLRDEGQSADTARSNGTTGVLAPPRSAALPPEGPRPRGDRRTPHNGDAR